MRAEPLLAVVLVLAGDIALAQQPLATDKSSGAVEDFVEDATESEKEELSAAEIFRRYAPRLLFLKPAYADDLNLPEDLRVEVQLVIKNALKQEGSYRVRTHG